jgi:hypothetical protein
MGRRILLASVCVVALGGLMPTDVVGQSGQQTPWGDPDLQGTYTFKTTTPLLRPDDLGDKEFLSEEEVAAQEQAALEFNQQLLDAPAVRAEAGGNVGAYNNFWLDPGTRPSGRTSLVVDPPNGQLPPRTPDGQRRHEAHGASFPGSGPFETWGDLELNDRCLFWSAGPPMLPTFYNNNFMVFQAPGYVVLHFEMIHDTRIIPLDDRAQLPTTMRQWIGSPRGHWEGDTLVVETRNIRRTESNAGTGALPGTAGGDVFLLRAANGRTDDTITITERFTRVDAGSVRYEFTVDDPTQWTQSISGEFPATSLAPGELMYEFACHEGNYTMTNILTGERESER